MSRCKQANKVEKNRSQARPEVSPQVESKGTARLQVAGGGFCSEAAGLPGRGSGWGTPAVSTTGSNQKSRRPGRRPKPEHPSLAPFLSPEPGEKHAPQVLPERRGAWRPAMAPWVPVRLVQPASWAGGEAGTRAGTALAHRRVVPCCVVRPPAAGAPVSPRDLQPL